MQKTEHGGGSNLSYDKQITIVIISQVMPSHNSEEILLDAGRNGVGHRL